MSSTNGFPFTTRKQVLTRITSEPNYAIECIRLLDAGSKWMASHRARASKLVARLASGEFSPEDLAEGVSLAMPYARTISRLEREKEIAERPELIAQAAVFGLIRPVEGNPIQNAEPPTIMSAAPVSTSQAPAAAPKKRGRPKGSKNKPKADSEPRRRRHRS